MSSTSPDPEDLAVRLRKAVRVRGVVQGVGFRPFVYRLATQEQLGGQIGNDTDGVIIEIEGTYTQIARFLERLSSEKPPLARIDSVSATPLPPLGETSFHIVASEVLGSVRTGIPADAATCSDCLRELLDPSNRRYRYPFLNCTNCGPRFTITSRIPYDRPQTSMAIFPMCTECEAEYHDPLNRRFHAQPNACWRCGPRLWLESAGGDPIESEDSVAGTIERLLEGSIVAIKGIGGFHLSVDAGNEGAVTRLRQRKRRYGKPLAVMVRNLDAARTLCELGDEEESLLESPARPIVLSRARPSGAIAPSVAPRIPWLGVFLPYSPLQHLLFADIRVNALVMTSANLSEEPIAIDNDDARRRLGNIADAFLMHNRDIVQRCDDSVAAIVDGVPQLLRRARGWVPLSVKLPLNSSPLLAVGGHLKNVFSLASGDHAYQSQHLGDLESPSGLEFFEQALRHLTRTFEIEPRTVVHDLHPGYLSTDWAKRTADRQSLRLIGVQHHHAHAASCMAENALEGSVIALSLDGTGYGQDGNAWGGEVLICGLDHFDRFAHLEYAPMPGGESAIREPWRMAFAHLMGAGFTGRQAEALTGASHEQGRVISRMVELRINAPLTSSLGRLFDAAAALILNRRDVDYDAQAAMELEGVAVNERDDAPAPDYVPELCSGVLQLGRLWHAIVDDLGRKIPPGKIAAQFHSGVAEGFRRAVFSAGEKTGIRRVVLSGGCMHNRRLVRLLRAGLQEGGFEVFTNRSVSPGDGGLSYGQAAVAAAILEKEDSHRAVSED